MTLWLTLLNINVVNIENKRKKQKQNLIVGGTWQIYETFVSFLLFSQYIHIRPIWNIKYFHDLKIIQICFTKESEKEIFWIPLIFHYRMFRLSKKIIKFSKYMPNMTLVYRLPFCLFCYNFVLGLTIDDEAA